jgi:exosortase
MARGCLPRRADLPRALNRPQWAAAGRVEWNLCMSSRAVTLLTAVALALCYAPVLRGMAGQWWNDEDMGHGFVVPLVIAWLLWRERDRWRSLSPRPEAWGFVLLGLAAMLHVASAVGVGLFAGAVALVLSMAGAVVAIGGRAYARAWAFPLFLSVFMLPKLAIVYNAVTLPLQLLASRLAALMLTLSGVAVMRQGNILDVGGHQVAVAEACSGMRYLLPLAFATLVLARITNAKPWMGLVLVLFTIPAAILSNAARVAISGYLPLFTETAYHDLLGWVLFVVCLAAVAGMHSLLKRAADAI